MKTDDYVQTLPYVLIAFCIAAYAFHGSGELLNLVIGGCLGVIAPRPSPPGNQP
jgi:hypothetical protein